MFRFIVMHCGFAESGATSALIYQCEFFGNPGYLSRRNAITDLALDMYAKFYDERLSVYQNRYLIKEIKKCCRKTLNDNKDANSCSECGDPIFDRKFDPEEFMGFIIELHSTTCDSYGEAESTYTRRFTWWPFWTENFIGAPKEDIILLAENAECILLAALLDAKPELKTENYEDWMSSDWLEIKENSL